MGRNNNFKIFSGLIVLFGFLFSSFNTFSQSDSLQKPESIIFKGKFIDTNQKPISDVSLRFLKKSKIECFSNENGDFELLIRTSFEMDRDYIYLVANHENYKHQIIVVRSIDFTQIDIENLIRYELFKEIVLDLDLKVVGKNPHETIITR